MAMGFTGEERTRGAKAAVTTGRCDICGQYAAVSPRKMLMFRGDGKTQPFEMEGFGYVSCDACEKKISNGERNRRAAMVLGCLEILFPISRMPFFDWHLQVMLGDLASGIVEFSFAVVPLLVLLYLTKVKKHYFQDLAAFRALREKRLKLCNKGLTDALKAFSFSFGTCALVSLLIVMGVRAWQNTWPGCCGVIIQSDTQCLERNSKGSITYRVLSRYQYEYAVGGKTFTGTGFDVASSKYDRTHRPLWPRGAPVTVWYDRENPSRSVIQKLNAITFGLYVIVMFVIFCFLSIVQMIYAHKGQKALEENRMVRC